MTSKAKALEKKRYNSVKAKLAKQRESTDSTNPSKSSIYKSLKLL